jgi:hypothetical protein
LLTAALVDVAETHVELGLPLPTPNASATDPEMDFEEPIYLRLSASSDIERGADVTQKLNQVYAQASSTADPVPLELQTRSLARRSW